MLWVSGVDGFNSCASLLLYTIFFSYVLCELGLQYEVWWLQGGFDGMIVVLTGISGCILIFLVMSGILLTSGFFLMPAVHTLSVVSGSSSSWLMRGHCVSCDFFLQ